MWNHDTSPLFSPRLTDDTFHPWHSRASVHDFWTSSAPGDDLATTFGTTIGALVCLVVFAVELLVKGGMFLVRVAWRMGRPWWQRLIIALLLSGILAGCEDVSRRALLVTGCDPMALDVGYCHMPKARP